MKTIFTFVIFLIVTSSYAQFENLDSLKLIVPIGRTEDNDFAPMKEKISNDYSFLLKYGLDNSIELYSTKNGRCLNRFNLKMNQEIGYNDVLYSDFSNDNNYIIGYNQYYFEIFIINQNTPSFVYNLKDKKVELNEFSGLIKVKLSLPWRWIGDFNSKIVSILPISYSVLPL